MSKVDFHRNIFLEIEELNRFQKFMLESNVNKTFLANTVNWGIIDTSGGTSSNDFKIEASSTPSAVMIQTLSRALQKDGLLIEQKPIDGIVIPNDSLWYWLKIGHTYTHIEEGTCSITVNGTLTGVGTKFTEVLRGVSTKVPVKIKFTSSNNTGIYDIVNVVDDLNAIVQGDSFVTESNMTYTVIGAVPLGETVTSEQQEGLYSYDSCIITQVAETVNDTPPAGLVTDEEFWVARVRNVGGTVTVQDKREYTVGSTSYSQYWEYYIRGVSDKLDKRNNLSDINNISTARTNLNVYSKEETDDLLNIDDTGWIALTPGDMISNIGFDMKIRRIGNYVNINGTFYVKSGDTIEIGETIFSIAYSTIGLNAAPTKDMLFQWNIIENEQLNHGIQARIEAYAEGQDTLYIKAYGGGNYMPDTAADSVIHVNEFYIA